MEEKEKTSKKTWMEGVQAAMTPRNLEPDQWRNREERSLVSGRWRQLFKKTGQIDRFLIPYNLIINNIYNTFYIVRYFLCKIFI